MSGDSNDRLVDDVRTPPPALPMRQMTDLEFRRLINHLLWLVVDEAEPLRDFGSRMIQHDAGSQSVWGPWPGTDLSSLLLRWYDAEFLALYNLKNETLPAGEARALLAAPKRWSRECGPFEPYVGATDMGAASSDAQWLSLVADLQLSETED